MFLSSHFLHVSGWLPVSHTLWVMRLLPLCSHHLCGDSGDKWTWDQGEMRMSGEPQGTYGPACHHILSWLTPGSDHCCFTLVFHIPCKFLFWPRFSWNHRGRRILGSLIPAATAEWNTPLYSPTIFLATAMLEWGGAYINNQTSSMAWGQGDWMDGFKTPSAAKIAWCTPHPPWLKLKHSRETRFPRLTSLQRSRK